MQQSVRFCALPVAPVLRSLHSRDESIKTPTGRYKATGVFPESKYAAGPHATLVSIW